MPRPPLPIGTYGVIRTKLIAPKTWEASARFRMADGRLKRVGRTGRSKADAVTRLKKAMTTLAAEVRGDEISGDTRMKRIAEMWTAELDREANLGDRSPGTVRNYRSQLKNWITPAIGELQARELTVTTCDRLVKKVQDATSYDTAKSVRAVLTGLCSYAVRHGAMALNPVRSVGRLARGTQKEVVALDRDQCSDLLMNLERLADNKRTDSRGRSIGSRAQVWQDLPDIVRTMLATGVRLGELLALTGNDVDPQERTVAVGHHLIRVNGQGLVRAANRKGNQSGLLLRLPEWSVSMLRRRKLASGGGPLFSTWNGEWLDPSNVIHRIQEAFADVGYGWVTSHVFRKTVASVLDEAGLPLSAIADQLGNTQKVADKHYRKRRVANEASAAALEGMFGEDTGA
ncbi:tyrosine-type recombinase/integrase [Amycolatopsis pigmentata]|uniref:Tyrosine-type recombinase/integrase n=1 Tax=Amycolatopsis pigmentata TaxID=450801 RepID=A0ABW5G2P4_9PSEU